MTEISELEVKGWEAWERHEEGEGPLTREEEELKGVREAEASEKAGMGKKGSVVSSGVGLQMREGVTEALEGLRRGEGGNLVVLVCWSACFSMRAWGKADLEAENQCARRGDRTCRN